MSIKNSHLKNKKKKKTQKKAKEKERVLDKPAE